MYKTCDTRNYEITGYFHCIDSFKVLKILYTMLHIMHEVYIILLSLNLNSNYAIS